MKPGSTHLPAASTTSVPAGGVKPGPSTAAIFPSRSRTVPPSMGSPSIGTTRPPTIAVAPAVAAFTRYLLLVVNASLTLPPGRNRGAQPESADDQAVIFVR